MTDMTSKAAGTGPDLSREWLARRHARERRFKIYGLAAITLALTVLVLLLVTLAAKSFTALGQTHIALPVTFDQSYIDAKTPGQGSYRSYYVALSVRSFLKFDPAATSVIYANFSLVGPNTPCAIWWLHDPSLIGRTEKDMGQGIGGCGHANEEQDRPCTPSVRPPHQ